MSSPMNRKLSINQRLDNLEEQMEGMRSLLNLIVEQADAGLKQAYQQLRVQGESLNAQADVLNAIVEITGQEQVETVAARQIREREVEQAENQKKAIKEAAEGGRITAVEQVDDLSIIEGIEYDTEGKPLHPGYWQFTFSRIMPEMKERVLGKKVGDKFATVKDGHTFEVTGVWKLVTQPEAPAAGIEA